jgi:hypothetical protein
MMGRSRSRVRVGIIMAALVLSALGTAAPGGADGHIREVAAGFVGPLGLSIGNDGTIYVADAFAGQLVSFTEAEPDDRTTLASAQGPIWGVDAKGKGSVVYVSGADATLNRVTPSGRSTVLASLGDYEAANNPDAGQTYGFLDLDDECRAQVPEEVRDPYTGIVDSNPYAVAIDRGSYLVVDAAGNTLLRVGANGRVSTVAVFPPVPQVVTQDIIDAVAQNPDFPLELPDCVLGATYTGEFVPTDVEIGPDGHYYVTSLPGAPEAPGEGSVWRVHRSSGALTMIASGFSGSVDLAVAADGTIYVAELFGGRISMVSGGMVSTFAEVPAPGAVEIGRDGTLYVTDLAFGAVLAITP